VPARLTGPILLAAALLGACAPAEPTRLSGGPVSEALADAQPVDPAAFYRWLLSGPKDCEDTRGILWTRTVDRSGAYLDDGDEGSATGEWRIDRRGLFCTRRTQGASETCYQTAELDDELLFLDLDGVLRYACFRDEATAEAL
jgi:hypothetical protein